MIDLTPALSALANESRPAEFHRQLKALLDMADVPEKCGCRLYGRCPECGAGDGQPCIQTCRHCDAEWPARAKACPCCGAPVEKYRRRRVSGMLIVVERNPAFCPLRHHPRPLLPACEHIQARDHNLPYECWWELMVLCNDSAFHPERNPDTYAHMSPPRTPEIFLRRAARVRARALRCGVVGLWHPDDMDQRQADEASPKSERTANGSAPLAPELVSRRGEAS